MAAYKIRIWDENAIVLQRSIVRRTLPAAFSAFDSAVYDVLAAFAKLDTIAAHKTMARAKAMHDILPIGECRSLTISNTGQLVSIARVS